MAVAHQAPGRVWLGWRHGTASVAGQAQAAAAAPTTQLCSNSHDLRVEGGFLRLG